MNKNIKEMISNELKKLRNDRNLTQSQLSELCGVDTSTIVRYEKNNVTMQIDTIIKIIEPFDINIFIFFQNVIAKTQKQNKTSILKGEINNI